jgi:hypothetical protein
LFSPFFAFLAFVAFLIIFDRFFVVTLSKTENLFPGLVLSGYVQLSQIICPVLKSKEEATA